MKISFIGWTAKIDDKNYGTGVGVSLPKIKKDKAGRETIKEMIHHIMPTLEKNLVYSVQKIMTGKTTTDDLIEHAKEIEKQLKTY